MTIRFKIEGDCVVEDATRRQPPDFIQSVLESLLWEYSGIKATLRISEYKEEKDDHNA